MKTKIIPKFLYNNFVKIKITKEQLPKNLTEIFTITQETRPFEFGFNPTKSKKTSILFCINNNRFYYINYNLKAIQYKELIPKNIISTTKEK